MPALPLELETKTNEVEKIYGIKLLMYLVTVLCPSLRVANIFCRSSRYWQRRLSSSMLSPPRMQEALLIVARLFLRHFLADIFFGVAAAAAAAAGATTPAADVVGDFGHPCRRESCNLDGGGSLRRRPRIAPV